MSWEALRSELFSNLSSIFDERILTDILGRQNYEINSILNFIPVPNLFSILFGVGFVCIVVTHTSWAVPVFSVYISIQEPANPNYFMDYKRDIYLFSLKATLWSLGPN